MPKRGSRFGSAGGPLRMAVGGLRCRIGRRAWRQAGEAGGGRLWLDGGAKGMAPVGVPEEPVQSAKSALTDLAELFQGNFFPPLLARALSDKEVVRLSTSNKALQRLLAPEVQEIHEKARGRDVADWLIKRDGRVDSIQFLLCMSYALVRSIACGDMLPFDRFIGAMAFGSRGFHADAVGFNSIHDIFDSEGEEEDEAEPWFY
ncbi:unnamed protein product [Ostreobium quekettii]|uniref:Uncharacterized protein n=1 Tax=Ostreobium quekettii TaxID=121088 RepID=A0A8S1JAP6_9CHLO|nr:unnamed protein product [Ostreobium quekettii]